MNLTRMKAVLRRLNGTGTRILQNAAGSCVARGHYEVTVEHFLAKCLEEPHSDFTSLLEACGAPVPAIRRAVERAVEDFKTGNQSKPAFSPQLMDLLQDAWLIGSLEFGATTTRTGAVLLAFMRRPLFFASGSYVDFFAELSPEALAKRHAADELGSCEADAPRETPQGEGGFLSRFCLDVTAKAAAGQIDPVFGRDDEIRQVLDILARRRKNNPILVGDPGVGKTAVIEGLARRIAEGKVPETLLGVRLLSLDMGLLEAGAGMKGEFENRLRGVIAEVKASPVPVVLFVDEAHTLIGAGGQQGGSDAANLLKPALARGELRTCAATTWSEYKKYFEKDPALARRFQPVKLDEPSVQTTGLILRGLRGAYEDAHQVVIRDEAIEAAAGLSARYITGRFLPDKAIDLLDTACARVKVNRRAAPVRLEACEHRIEACRCELAGLERDEAHGFPQDPDRLQRLRDEAEALEQEADQLRERWEREREAVARVLEARSTLEAERNAPQQERSEEPAPAAPDSPAETAAPRNETSEALREAVETLKAAQGESPLIQLEVTGDVVAQVVSDWTGIPLGKMARRQAETVLDLRDSLERRIKGQGAALDIICRRLRAARAGLTDPGLPLGVFLLVGPSGTGKTETALALADQLFGDERSLITINMSEYQEKHTASRLIGSPPGYVGYGEGGVLTEAVRQRPYSVVLLDELEKAHPDILNLFLQVFSKGELRDGEGNPINFKNTVCLATSNLGADLRLAGEPAATVAERLRPVLLAHLKPALLSRMTVAPYLPLDADAMRAIVAMRLDGVAQRLAASFRLDYGDAAVERIAALCLDGDAGARAVDALLDGAILPHLAVAVLRREAGSSVRLDIDDADRLTLHFPGDDVPPSESDAHGEPDLPGGTPDPSEPSEQPERVQPKHEEEACAV